MRNASVLWLCGLMVGAVMAQDDTEAQRRSIATARAQAQAEFAAQEAACAKRFAVSACMEEVAVQRRANSKNLARQEAELNKAERAQRAADQQQRLDEKARERADRDARTQTAVDASQEKLQQQRDKQARHHAQAASAASSPSVAPQPGLAASAQTANRQAFQQKLKAAQERKAARDKRLREAGQPRQLLPLPR